MMENEKACAKHYGSLESTTWSADVEKETDIISMADSTITVDDIEDELFKIERIRDILVRRESELRYMMDDIQLCKEITRLKKELQKLVSIPDKDKSNEDKQKEEELLQQIHKLVETRDFLVDDVEFERLREREEDKEMADFLQTKLSKACSKKSSHGHQSPHAVDHFWRSKTPTSTKKGSICSTTAGLNVAKERKMTSRAQQTTKPFMAKTGLTLLKECCGFTCSIM
ncbi:bMERB domain-containing protein 1-like isoform X2 [Hemitrygon akajei]|uniref:bMERB domain-containing protein 1-like isoform X2 n=1 Tax=Hemitrygon akajei TaxID=2704970 RepID=UPI003BF98BA2